MAAMELGGRADLGGRATASGHVVANLAVQHILGAARFARRVGQIEAEKAGEPFGEFFTEITAHVNATVLSSAAALEAAINETFLNPHNRFFAGMSDPLRAKLWALIERQGVLEKYQLAMTFRGHEDLDRKGEIFKDADLLIQLRNAIVHFKSEWRRERRGTPHGNLEQALRSKFPPSPFLEPTAPWFPMGCMSHGCARWAVTTAVAFEALFSASSGLPGKFHPFRDRLGTEPPPSDTDPSGTAA